MNIRSIPSLELPPDGEEVRRLLLQRLRSYRLDDFLGSLSWMFTTFSREELREQLPKEQAKLWPANINPQQIAFLAKMAIVCGGNDHRSNRATFDQYKELANLYMRLDTALMESETEIEAWEAYFMRLSYHQFLWHMDEWSAMARAVLLFHLLPARLPDDKFDIQQAFEEVFGLPALDFFCLGLLLWKELNDLYPEPFFTATDLSTVGATSYGERGVKLLLDRVAGDYQQFREAYDETNPVERYELYTFNPLEGRPVVATQRSGYVCPVPVILLRRLTTGAYYDLVKRFGKKFADAFGPIFEAYAGDLLQSVYRREELFHEPPYKRGRDQLRSTDWIVVEGNTATLLECKTARLTLPTKAYADQRTLEEDLVRGVVGALVQMDKVMKAIREPAPGLERFANVDRFVPVVLVYDAYFLANTAPIRDIVHRLLREAKVEPFPYQVISVHELEGRMETIKREGLARLLLDKMSDEEHRWQSTSYADFSTYLSNRFPEEPRSRSTVLRDAWQVLADRLRELQR